MNCHSLWVNVLLICGEMPSGFIVWCGGKGGVLLNSPPFCLYSPISFFLLPPSLTPVSHVPLHFPFSPFLLCYPPCSPLSLPCSPNPFHPISMSEVTLVLQVLPSGLRWDREAGKCSPLLPSLSTSNWTPWFLVTNVWSVTGTSQTMETENSHGHTNALIFDICTLLTGE